MIEIKICCACQVQPTEYEMNVALSNGYQLHYQNKQLARKKGISDAPWQWSFDVIQGFFLPQDLELIK